jgi:hypothetical protein
VPDGVTLEGPPRGPGRHVVAAQTVVQHRPGVGREADHPAQAAGGRLPVRNFDEGGSVIAAPPGREHHLRVLDGGAAGRLGDQAALFEQIGRRSQVTGHGVGPAEVGQGRLQVDQGARVTGVPDLAGGQVLPRGKVPQLQGNDAASP